MVIIVMGVAGSGKSTVGQVLAASRGCQFIDADDYHPKANVEKMSTGEPLDDADREPWLSTLRALINKAESNGESMVLACSALKKAYREKLGVGEGRVRLVYLWLQQAEIEKRLSSRVDHFFGKELAASQFAALEEPWEGEGALVVEGAKAVEELVELINERLA